MLWKANGDSIFICIFMSLSERSLKKILGWSIPILLMHFSNMIKWNCLGSFRGRTLTSVLHSSARSVLLLTDLPWASQKSSSIYFFNLNLFSLSQCLQSGFCLMLQCVSRMLVSVTPLLQSLKTVSVECLLADYLWPLPIPMTYLTKINPFDSILLEIFPLRFAH